MRFNDVLSDYVSLHGEVSQGTKLGLIGFQVLINEVAKNSSSKCWKYVDDLTFPGNSTCSHYSSSSLLADLDDFTKWSKDDMLKDKSRNRTFSKIENLRFFQTYDDYNSIFGIKLKGYHYLSFEWSSSEIEMCQL